MIYETTGVYYKSSSFIYLLVTCPMSVPNHASGSPGFASAKCHHEPDRQDTWWRGTGYVNPWVNKQIPFFYHNMGGGYLWLITFLGVSDPILASPFPETDLRRSLSRWNIWPRELGYMVKSGQFGHEKGPNMPEITCEYKPNQKPHVGAVFFFWGEDPCLKWWSLGEWLGKCAIRVVVDLLPVGHIETIIMSSSIKFQEPISDPDGIFHKVATPKSYDA